MRWARRAASWRRAREGGTERGGGMGAVEVFVGEVVLVGEVERSVVLVESAVEVSCGWEKKVVLVR